MGGDRPDRLLSQLYKLSWGFYLILGLAGVVWIGAREGTIPLSLFVRRQWFLDLGLGVASGIAMIAIWWAVARAVPLAREMEAQFREVLGSLDESQAVALAVMSGFAEELFFRGAVQGSLGYLPATLLFGLLHTGRERSFRLWTGFALVSGLLLGGLVLWTGNLLASIVGHVVVNGVNLYRIASAGEPEEIDETGGDGT